ncbi:unnamed protein product [Echinostoma caproni]|uniref:WD_REPEATS_REGION domain-containing protein n=1 Tax=Echinostoma caproni TaxID=27848 RepID=A0A183ALZ5_9TREM|nr:unnamed protein product [Echinostoma caproni]
MLVVSATFFGPNSEYVVSGSDDGFFYIWDRESEGIVQWLHADSDGAVNVIESHPTLPVLASAGLDFDFKVWTPLHPLSEPDDLSHLKYTFSRVPPDILRLRRSRLAHALFPTNRSNGSRVVSEDVPTTASELNEVNSNVTRQTTSVQPSADTLIENGACASKVIGESGSSLVVEPPVVASPQQTLRKRRRYHSSTSDVPDMPEENRSRDSEIGMRLEVHSDSGDCDGLSPRSSGSRHFRRPRRRRRFSPTADRNTSECMEVKLEASSNPVEPISSTHSVEKRESSTVQPRLPQYLLPFNQRDLELRVAQNWVNRTCELRQMDSLDEVDSRIMSALETVAQLHARESRPENDSHESDESSDTNGSTDDSGIMGSFLLIRRPNCPTEHSEETLTTRDRSEQAMDNANSDNGSWTTYDSTQSTESSQDSLASHTSTSSSSTSTISSGSGVTAVAASTLSLLSPISNGSELSNSHYSGLDNTQPDCITASDVGGDTTADGELPIAESSDYSQINNPAASD